MEFNFSSKPNRRFLMRLWGSIALTLLLAVTANFVIQQSYVSGLFSWVVALIPGLAAIGAFYAMVMLVVEQQDEFIRMLVLRQIIFGAGFAFALSACWGFLERFDLVGQINPFYFIFAFFIGCSFGSVVNRLTHGAWGEMS